MNARAQSHRDLIVWQKAMDLAEQVYKIAGRFPASEANRLAAQLTRAVVPVPANIAEGNARGSRKDCANFLAIAKRFLMETETFLVLAIRLKYIGQQVVNPTLNLITETS